MRVSINAVMGRPCATEVSAITRIRRRGRHRRYGRGGLSSGPSRCSASISLQRATQSLQIATPGPARTASTCPAVLEQNEHWRDGSEPWSRGSVSKDRLGRTGLGRTGSNLTGLLPSALGLTGYPFESGRPMAAAVSRQGRWTAGTMARVRARRDRRSPAGRGRVDDEAAVGDGSAAMDCSSSR